MPLTGSLELPCPDASLCCCAFVAIRGLAVSLHTLVWCLYVALSATTWILLLTVATVRNTFSLWAVATPLAYLNDRLPGISPLAIVANIITAIVVNMISVWNLTTSTAALARLLPNFTGIRELSHTNFGTLKLREGLWDTFSWYWNCPEAGLYGMDVITHPCHNINVIKLPLKLWHGWVITSLFYVDVFTYPLSNPVAGLANLCKSHCMRLFIVGKICHI